MAGVEILNQIEVVETQIGIGLGWVFLIGVAIFALIFVISGFDELGAIAGAIVGVCIAIVMVLATAEGVPTGEYQYEVIVEDNVNLQEFYDHYDIIEQRGKIFVVEERTTE